MKYWTMCYPGEFGQHVAETFSEDQIILSYYTYWSTMMIKNQKGADISREHCIQDWITVHWAEETNEFGLKL